MKKAIVAIIIIAVGIAVYFFSVRGPEIQQEKGVVKIGVIEPLTGNRAEAGQFISEGLEIALAEINNSRSTKKYKIQLIYEDSQYQPAKGVSAYQKLRSIDGVKFIIGAHNSSVTLAISALAEKEGVLIMSPGSQSDKISDAGDYIFRTQIRTAQEIPILLNYVAGKIDRTKPLHIMYINNDAGLTLIDNAKRVAPSVGLTLGEQEKFDPENFDYRTMLLKLKQQRPEYILLYATPKQAGFILKQMQELGVAPKKIFSGSPIEGKELLDLAGTLTENLVYTYPYNSNARNTTAGAFRGAYKEKYGRENEMLAANAYDALQILSLAIEKTGPDPLKVKDYLYTVKNYDGASGVFSFDENGDVVKDFIFKTVRNGEFVVLEE